MINSVAQIAFGTQQRGNLFSKIDINSDSAITKEEFVSARPKQVSEAKASELFDKIDTSKTGSIDESQFKEGMEKNRPKESGRNFENMLGGAVLGALLNIAMSESENETAMNEKFASLDSDGSGEISKEEFATGMKDKPSGPSGPPPPKGNEASGEETEKDTNYDSLDTNQDGKISMSELLAAFSGEENDEGGIKNKLIEAFVNSINEYANETGVNLDETIVFNKQV